jgi:hypothetical protein
MNVSVFGSNFKSPRTNKLENITLRGFGGGWNAVETDLQMESTYLVTAKNFRRTPGGTQKIRYGSKWFADLSNVAAAGSHIVDMEYFAESLICVLSTGVIVAVDGSGAKTIIWNTAIAVLLPGAPAAWSGGLTSVDFVPYKNTMIIHNGIDKPITISRLLVVTYLQDLATGSNVNTPIGKYGCVVSNYHCIGGIPATPTTIFISSVGTAGTFVGDPIPNDSISVDVGAFAPQGALDIRGIAGFRSNLLVFFQDQTVIVRLGQYNAAGVHTPFFPDTMPTFGLLGHRCISAVENDLLFAGLAGMASARRNLLSVSGTLESQTLSEKVEPPYRQTIGLLTDNEQLKSCWMLYDALSHDMLLFTPTGRVFVYSFSTKLKYSAWSEYEGIDVQCGCKSFLGRVFYADTLRIYQHGNAVFEDEQFYFDRTQDRDFNWANNTNYNIGDIARDVDLGQSYECILGHKSNLIGTFANDRETHQPRWELFVGIDIAFELELPWLDSKDPMKVKMIRFINMATKGDAQFTVNAYVDNLYKATDGTILFQPSLSMDFIGNEASGHGYAPQHFSSDTHGEGPYGGGRRSGDPRLYKFPVKFKTLKIAVVGAHGGNLEIVNMSFLFSRGKYKR